MLNYYSKNFPIGKIYFYTEENFLVGLSFTPDKKLQRNATFKNNPIIKETIKQLEEYFSGSRQKFDLPLKIIGTDFQKKVWKGLLSIPYCQTISYGELALKIKHPHAYRAVGTANGKNSFPIIIPCHRVIKSSGEIGEYTGGCSIKKQLLKLENNFKTNV